jgi:pyruvate,water dikinase
MFNFFKLFKKCEENAVQDDAAKDLLNVRYKAFQHLLDANNQVLELMADMEEKFSGEYLFDIHYIKTNVRLIGYEMLKIIENLDVLSGNKYKEFHEIHKTISQEIESVLEYKMEVPVSDLTVQLENLTGKTVGIAGGKIAHLAEIKSALDLPAPDGFVISAYAFIKFMDHGGLIEKISGKLADLNIENLEELNAVSKEIHDMISNSDVPPDLQESIEYAYAKLCKKTGKKPMVAVRSSAIREDSEFSFAGQYATFLNVPGDLILQTYKAVVASLFTPRAIFYAKTKGFSETEMVMAVGVLNMIDAVAGGVMYSRDPNDPATDHILINAVHGLGVTVVDGTVTPDTYTVSRHPEGTIVDRILSHQETMLINAATGELKEEPIPDDMKGRQCLPDEQIKILAKYALELEHYYGCPQDIEWALGRDGKIYILQSRPLRILVSAASGTALPTRFETYPIILDKGVIACKGVGFGHAFILKEEEDLGNFPEGAVLIARHTSPKFVTVMNKAAAIITDVGSATGHMASLSREYQIPTILDTDVATSVIRNGQEITVDAINCNVYEGKVDELLQYARNKKEPFRETHLFKTLEKVLKWVVPLNLTNPDADNFMPAFCKTYHDITRFAHEKAMHEMFSMGEEGDIEGARTIQLCAGIPVNIHLLNINGGVRDAMRKVTPDDVFSVPLSALLRGMKTMRWPGPPPVDAKGFMGMLAHTASVPEDQLQEAGKKSFAVVSKNYVNFSIRLGYHFSLIESYAGENINDNYVKFFFKGGGAALDRRLRRVRLIKEILKEMGFKVSIKEDVMNAILTKYKQSTIEEVLVVMGKLTAYTKQLDMAMFNDAVTDMYIDQFIKEHIRKPSQAAK